MDVVAIPQRCSLEFIEFFSCPDLKPSPTNSTDFPKPLIEVQQPMGRPRAWRVLRSPHTWLQGPNTDLVRHSFSLSVNWWCERCEIDRLQLCKRFLHCKNCTRQSLFKCKGLIIYIPVGQCGCSHFIRNLTSSLRVIDYLLQSLFSFLTYVRNWPGNVSH